MSNTDGFRSGFTTAGHEAAHAVIAILSGFAVGRVSIAPSKKVRERAAGFMEPGRRILRHSKQSGVVLAPLTDTAEVDALAAGCAWEKMRGATEEHLEHVADGDLRIWIAATDGKCAVVDAVEQWADAVDRVAEVLDTEPVKAAVLRVAERLMASKSGEVWGTTVEKLMAAQGLKLYGVDDAAA